MKAFLIALTLLVAGCEPPPQPVPSIRRVCDYCKVEQDCVRGYPCQKCQGMHWRCPLEQNLTTMGWDHMWLIACPQK